MMLNINDNFKTLIPTLSSDEFSQLEENIIRDGIREPLSIWNDTIIDGHNRYEIATKHDLIFETKNYNFENEENVIEWIIKNQLGRRNLTAEQKAYLIGLQYEREKKRKEDNLKQNLPNRQNVASDNTAKTIGKQHNISDRTVERNALYTKAIDTIAQNTTPDIKDKILSGETKLTKQDTIKLANIEPEKQKVIVNKVVDEGIAVEKAIKEIKAENRKEEIKEKIKDNSSESQSVDIYSINKKYRVIYADPAWSYNDKCENGGVQARGANGVYPTMSISEICKLPVKSIADDNAVLFLWVTSPLLEECFEVIKAWGFKYKSSFVWDKIQHNMGHYNSVRHELLLICTKGSCTPDNKKLFDSVQSIERLEHSKKPEEFRNIINELYLFGNKIELFSRNVVNGWDCWGNMI